MNNVELMASKFPNAIPTENGMEDLCPAHDDINPSLHIYNNNGNFTLKCFAGCTTEEICKAKNITPDQLKADRRKKIKARYPYCATNGELLYEVVRYEPKTFRQRRKVNGKWVGNLRGVNRVLYKTPELYKLPANSLVFVVEGEKDCENLIKLGFNATTSSGGAQQWKNTDTDLLHGKRIAVIPDNDEPGMGYALTVANDLYEKVNELKILKLNKLPKKGDVSDWIENGGTKDQLLKIHLDADKFNPSDFDTPVTLDPSNPYEIAKKLIQKKYILMNSKILRYHKGDFYFWDQTYYRILEKDEVRTMVYNFLDNALQLSDKDDARPISFKPNTSRVNNIIDSLGALLLVPKEISAPSWLSNGYDKPQAINLLATKSQFLSLEDYSLITPSPDYFCTNALEFDYDADAPPPKKWLTFLHQLWHDDKDAIKLLQEWFGYCLTPDTSFQKINLLVGPKRAGKGTIGRIITKLIGKRNVTNPTLSSFSQNFGLWSWIGKSLAIVPDARLSFGPQQNTIVERLLSISGEDSLTIDRKHQTPIESKLLTRIMFLTNELPQFSDASGALSSRFLILGLKESFFEKEDHKLEEKLSAELTGILNWAIEGRKRLHENGRFTKPQSSKELETEFECLLSPIKAFIDQCCDLGPGKEIPISDLFEAWGIWCKLNGKVHSGNIQTFGKKFRSAYPNIGIQYPRIDEKSRVRFYIGIALKDIRTGEF